MKDCSNIAFIHQGYSWYLPFVLYQAKSVNPNSNIVLIGNSSEFDGVSRISLDELRDSQYISDFKEKYVHMSDNSLEFELFCWLRWFYLLEYMQRNSIESIVHLDSDVLLFSSLEQIKSSYSDVINDCGYIVPEQSFDSLIWSASAHVSYWTYEFLEEFCDFTIRSFSEDKYIQLYQKKWKWHQQNGASGGICDMTTLYLFRLEKGSLVANLAMNHNNNTFDSNINSAANYLDNEFKVSKGIKKIDFVNGKPMFTTDEDEQPVQVHAVHFQGRAKQYIPIYYQGNNFKGKMSAELIQTIKRPLKRLKRIIR